MNHVSRCNEREVLISINKEFFLFNLEQIKVLHVHHQPDQDLHVHHQPHPGLCCVP